MQLFALSQHPNLSISADIPDARGWEVWMGPNDGAVGRVHDMICDASGSPRYLDIDLGALQRHVLVPIRLGRVDEARHVVHLPSLTQEQVAHLPEYTHDLAVIPDEHEISLRQAYQSEPVGGHQPYDAQRFDEPRRPALTNVDHKVEAGREEIRVPILEEELVVTKRMVVKEVLVIKKRKIEETREVEAELRKERVHVERRGQRAE